MARNTSVRGGFYQDPKASGDKHDKERTNKSTAKSKFFRNFWRTKQKAYMLTYDDDQQLNIMLNVLSDITSAGDPHTAFDTLLTAWVIGAKTGDMKTIDATELQNWIDWVKEWVTIAWDIAAQMALRPMLPGVTEVSTTTTTNATITIWTQADWDAFIQSLERLDCPDFVYRFMKPFLYTIQLTEAYMKAELPVPPSYLLLIAHVHNLANLQAHRDTAKGLAGSATTHAAKYKIPFSKFSSAKLKSIVVKRKDMFLNQDLIALFNILPFKYCNNDPAVTTDFHGAILTGANLTTDFTNAYYLFDDSQEMSMIHALFPLFGTAYHVDNNPYGEIITQITPGATEYYVPMLRMKLSGTAWTAGISYQVRYAAELMLAYWKADAQKALVWSGTKVTADQTPGLTAYPAFIENPNVCYDTGHVKGEEAIDSAFNAARYCIYGD